MGRLDAAAAREALTFAFASGDGDVFTRLLEHTPVAASRFAPDDFARDLELPTFVARCLPVVAQGASFVGSSYPLRVLASPPSERAHIEHRQAICAELLSSPPLAARLEALYVRLRLLRERLGRPSTGFDAGVERRLSILEALRDVVELMQTGFAGTTSGLRRLHRFGSTMAESEGYARACELLDYEQNRALIELRVGLGFDGRIRTFQALAAREQRSSRFYSTALGRLWTRLSLLCSGYRATTGEILSRLVDAVFQGLETDVVFLFQLIGDLEVYLGALAFQRRAAAAGLAVCLPELGAEGHTLTHAFNPWLVAEGRACIPCDLSLGKDDQLVLITGPNSGGKTRLLQTLCLSQLLGQAGLFVPAAHAELPLVNGLFASLSAHVQFDQVEGRLGTELLRVRRLFERLRSGSLVVMDELCSGTNPSEGEALLLLVLEALQELEPRAFVTTHFLELSARLERARARACFLQTELDADEQPTYRFVSGVATTSLAARVAERLGVTREALRALVLANNPELALRARAGARGLGERALERGVRREAHRAGGA